MSIRYQYENLLREPVEYWPAAIYGVGAVTMLILPDVFLMPQLIGYAGAAVFAVRGFWRFRQARKISKYQKQLTSLASFTSSSSTIGYSNINLWMGKGFRFDGRHTQRLFDLEKSEHSRFRRLPTMYRMARKFEINFEHVAWIRPLLKFTSSQSKYNPVKPIPDGGGKPEIHAVGMWEGEEDIYLDLANRNGHMLLLGTTRVGKTRFLEIVVAQDIRRGDTVFVFDPKGDADLLLRMYAECVASGREDVFHIFHLGHPEISDAYNPIGSFMRVTEVATRVAGQMPGEGASLAFREFVWGYVNTLSKVFVAMGKKPTYGLVKQHTETIEPLFVEYFLWYFEQKALEFPAHKNWLKEVEMDEAELSKKADDRNEEFKAQFKTPKDMQSRQAKTIALYKYYKDHPDLADDVGNSLCSKINYESAHMNKLIASLQPFLDKMTTGKVASLMMPDGTKPTFDWSGVIQKKGVVYVGLDALSDPEVAAAVGNSMFADLTSIAGQIYNTGHDYGLPERPDDPKKKKGADDKKHKIQLHADEFNELIGSEFIPMLNKAGGAGIQVTAYTQTLTDIEARLGNKAKAGQVIGNFNTLVMMRVLDPSTAELMTKRQKQVQVVTTDLISGSTDNSDVTSTTLFSSNTNQRQTRQNADLITTNDLLSLPKGQAFALINGNNLYKIRMPLPDHRDLEGIPKNILDVSKAMRQSYQSVAAEQFRFVDTLGSDAFRGIPMPKDNYSGIHSETAFNDETHYAVNDVTQDDNSGGINYGEI